MTMIQLGFPPNDVDIFIGPNNVLWLDPVINGQCVGVRQCDSCVEIFFKDGAQQAVAFVDLWYHEQDIRAKIGPPRTRIVLTTSSHDDPVAIVSYYKGELEQIGLEDPDVRVINPWP